MEDLVQQENNNSKEDFSNEAIVVSLEKFYHYLDKNNLLIVGSRKGVGFSKYMAMWVAYKLFFNDNYKCLIWCNSPRDRVYMINDIVEEYRYYGKELVVDSNLLFSDRENGSAVLIEDYHDYEPSAEYGHIDLFIVDKDYGKEELYDIILKLHPSVDNLIINTYDTAESIIYNIDAPKIILKSNYYHKNHTPNQNEINSDRVWMGRFETLNKIYDNGIL